VTLILFNDEEGKTTLANEAITVDFALLGRPPY
jgi:hypothetical protein